VRGKRNVAQLIMGDPAVDDNDNTRCKGGNGATWRGKFYRFPGGCLKKKGKKETPDLGGSRGNRSFGNREKG